MPPPPAGTRPKGPKRFYVSQAFDILPVELNGEIASYLVDTDLVTFNQVCHATHAALEHPSSSVWRTRFAEYFDVPPRTSNDKLKAIYQYRKRVLRHGARFTHGRTRREKDCLQVLVDLATEAYHGEKQEEDGSVAKNLEILAQFARNSDLLQNVLSPRFVDKPNPVLVTIQVLLIHIQLDLSFKCPTLGFPGSQQIAYATADDEPIFRGANKTEINMSFVANTINFFKYHMLRPDQYTLHSEYSGLKPGETIKPWQTKLVNGAQKLGRYWNGAYAYLDHDELATIRDIGAEEANVIDNFGHDDGGDAFQTLELEFPSTPQAWPPMFEHYLKAKRHPSAEYLTKMLSTSSSSTKRHKSSSHKVHRQTRSSPPVMPSTNDAESSCGQEKIDPEPVSFQFSALGADMEEFMAMGWLNPLPPQNGIPGWQRWTMMKFFVDFDTESEGPHGVFNTAGQDNSTKNVLSAAVAAAAADAVYEGQDLWAYEGVVLPGGQVVVGRWWHPKRVEAKWIYSGPFMFWRVDG